MRTASVVTFLIVMSFGLVAIAAEPATMPTTTRSDDSLAAEAHRTVELAQQAFRNPKPTPAPQPRTTLQKQAMEAATTKPVDVLKQLASEFEGKSGLVAIRVSDVLDNRHPPYFVGAMHSVHKLCGKTQYLIRGDFDNPTPTYLTKSQKDRVQYHRQRDQTREIASIRATAEQQKPLHEVWVFSDDPAVATWSPGSRHMIRATSVEAKLSGNMNGYVKAELVLLMGARNRTP